MAIKNIIFDLGGVLLHIDFKATHKAFEKLGISDVDSYFSQHHATELFEQLEAGAIDAHEFYEGFREITQAKHLTDGQIQQAWNAMLLDFSEQNVALLESLRDRYNIYLFSNTNALHYDQFSKAFEAKFQGKTLNNLFTHAWYSHEKGIRKPYASAFKILLETEKLDPAETLFIDDTIGNIQGAASVGLQTHLLKDPADLLLLDL